MGELDDSFTLLFRRQANDEDKQDLYRVRDVLKVKTTDSVWSFLMRASSTTRPSTKEVSGAHRSCGP